MYFFIRHSLDINITGHYPQVQEVIYKCDVWVTPLFVDRFQFDKIPHNSIVANPVLHPQAELTDLIYLSDIGFTSKLLISGKLKTVLQGAHVEGMQFIQCSVFHHGIEYSDYWLLHIYEPNDELIDFTKSKVAVREKKQGGGTLMRFVNEVNSFKDYEELRSKHEPRMEIIEIEPVTFKKDIHADLLKIRSGGRFAVSSKMKDAITDFDCTGIEFQPCEVSFNDWLKSGGQREKVYGKV